MGSLEKTTTLMVLTLLAMTSSGMVEDRDPIKKEMKCLNLSPEPKSQCNVVLTYEPYGDVNCDQTIPMDFHDDLQNQPLLSVVEAGGRTNFPTPVLIFMFDIDLDLEDVAEGFVHWVAKGKMNRDGSITNILVDNKVHKYKGPNPPAGDKHRYQVFIFPFDYDKTAQPRDKDSRLDTFCGFKTRNNLPPPLASTQFRYEAVDRK